MAREARVSEEVYANIRDLLGDYIGRTIVDITQHDKDEWELTRQSFVMFMFDDGKWVKFFIGDEGFVIGEGTPGDETEGEDQDDE
jgi:hypothetical protein